MLATIEAEELVKELVEELIEWACGRACRMEAPDIVCDHYAFLFSSPDHGTNKFRSL